MIFNKKIWKISLIITLNFVFILCLTKNEILHQTKLAPCRACKNFVDSFKKGLTRTEKGKFEGGDTAWEEKKMGSYARSEIRLIEIQEKVCVDIVEGRDQCYTILGEYDSEIEDWWFNKQEEEPDFFKYFCIDNLKHCCPENHYGPNCVPCPGFPDNICSNNGKCKGSGTRKGNGKCTCDVGYKGNVCSECNDNFFEAYKDDSKLLCSQCHTSCEGNCTKAGPTGCENCKKGYLMSEIDKEKSCVDINECAAKQFPCNPLQFCVNTEGSFKCLECDRACAGCTGDGPDMCVQCAKGYILVDNMCIDSEQESRKTHVFFTRYLTYLGLCIATCIILNKNTILAAMVGIAVAVYISLSEYILNLPPTPKTDDIAQQILKATS